MALPPINRDPGRLEEIEHLVPGMQLWRSVVFSFCPLKQANKTTAFVILYGEQSVHGRNEMSGTARKTIHGSNMGYNGTNALTEVDSRCIARILPRKSNDCSGL